MFRLTYRLFLDEIVHKNGLKVLPADLHTVSNSFPLSHELTNCVVLNGPKTAWFPKYPDGSSVPLLLPTGTGPSGVCKKVSRYHG